MTKFNRVADMRRAWRRMPDRPEWIRYVARLCNEGAISVRLALNAVAAEREGSL